MAATRVGDAGGDVPNATDRDHGDHAAGGEILFDPAKASSRQLLEVFFQIHGPPPQRYGGAEMRIDMLKALILVVTHAGTLGLGFALGVYMLPILTAPKGPDASEIAAASSDALFRGTFTRDLAGSDFLHWGEGDVMISATRIVHSGDLAPGPDYRIYLTNDFVETEEEFLAVKDSARDVGEVKSFDGFVVDLPTGVDPANYSVIVIWCEAFSEFITAAKYR